MEVTISQVRERTPIQTQGMVTVFRNWLNWWNVNAAKNNNTTVCIYKTMRDNVNENTAEFWVKHPNLSGIRHDSWLHPPASQNKRLSQR